MRFGGSAEIGSEPAPTTSGIGAPGGIRTRGLRLIVVRYQGDAFGFSLYQAEPPGQRSRGQS